MEPDDRGKEARSQGEKRHFTFVRLCPNVLYANGQKRIVSEWNLRPIPRDLNQPLTGCVADGITRHYDEQGRLTATYHFKNGILQDDQQQGSSGLVGDM